MTIELNHMIVPARDKEESVRFYERIFAFKVSEAEFDENFGRIVHEGLAYGSDPGNPENMATNHWNGGRGVYFRDPSGHLLELPTRDYAVEHFARC